MTEPFTEDTEAHIVSAIELVDQMAREVVGLDARLDAEIAAAQAKHPSNYAADLFGTFSRLPAEQAEIRRSEDLAPVFDLTAYRPISRAAVRKGLGL